MSEETNELFQHPPYPKTARELKVDELCNAVRSATPEELPEAQRQLIAFLEN